MFIIVRVFYVFIVDLVCVLVFDFVDIIEYCGILLMVVFDYCVEIVYECSSFSGIVCVGCMIDFIGYLINSDLM